MDKVSEEEGRGRGNLLVVVLVVVEQKRKKEVCIKNGEIRFQCVPLHFWKVYSQKVLAVARNERQRKRVTFLTQLRFVDPPLYFFPHRASSDEHYLHTQGPDGLTPLMVAASAGSLEALKVLIEAGADTNATHAFAGQTALHMAAELDQVRGVS